jgi:hypothetical protein
MLMATTPTTGRAKSKPRELPTDKCDIIIFTMKGLAQGAVAVYKTNMGDGVGELSVVFFCGYFCQSCRFSGKIAGEKWEF